MISPSEISCSTHPLDMSSSHVTNAIDRHLYISVKSDLSLSVICDDGVLCYLSNIIGHGSLVEIEDNLKRYFSSEQINQALNNLRHCLEYTLSTIDLNKDQEVFDILQQCSINLIDTTAILLIMETIYNNQFFSYLPVFITNDWLHMIRSVQNLEKLDLAPTFSISNLAKQMLHLKDHLTLLHNLVNKFYSVSSSIPSPSASTLSFADQCCLRTSCPHNPSIYPSTPMILIDSISSSPWSSTEMNINPVATVTGFIRNPVTNFIMPIIDTTSSDMESSFVSIDDNLSTDDEQEIPSFSFCRRYSDQSTSSRTGPIVVKRADGLWMYPAAVLNPRNQSLFSSVHESLDPNEFKPHYGRANSCDIDLVSKHKRDSEPKIKPKRPSVKQKQRKG